MGKGHEHHKKNMFLWNVKTYKIDGKQMLFERLQVEDMNGKRCQGNIERDVKNNTKINEKLCWIYA